MKIIYSFAFLLFLAVDLTAATYYSQGSLSATLTTSWSSTRTGVGGSAPANFTTASDVFVIQNGHSMSATGWNPGSVTIRIESGGILTATGAITLSGTFEIQNGGKYIHNASQNNTIFSGTEVFADSSIVEIQNWSNGDLPSGVQFGNLVLNRSLSNTWNLKGVLTNVAGSLTIETTGTGRIDLTDNTGLLLTIGKDLVVKGTLYLESNANNAFARVQVNRNVQVQGGTINLGEGTAIGNNDLRFKGDLSLTSGSITTPVAGSGLPSTSSYLVANGTTPQTVSVGNGITIGTNFKVSPGAVVNVSSDLGFVSQQFIVVSGEMNVGVNRLVSIPDGQLVVPGGKVTVNQGYIEAINSNCTVCTGDGNYTSGSWCKSTGTKGSMTINQGSITFSTSAASALDVGQVSSPGDLDLLSSTVDFSADPGGLSGIGRIELYPSSNLNIDINSLIQGEAYYNGMGGKLIVGTVDGISLSGPTGAIQINGTRNYTSAGNNSFEFRSSEIQETGDGIPSEITGDLVINSAAVTDVILSKAVTVKSPGRLLLTSGFLTTIGSNDIRIDAGATVVGGSPTAYVNGRLRKVGNTAFTFPVGKNGLYSPVVMANKSGQKLTDEFFAEYFPANPNSFIPGATVLPPLDLISSMEYWEINSDPENLVVSKNITLPFSTRSGVQNPGSLVAAYYDGTGYWQNYGSDAVTGSSSAGTLTFDTDFYGYFTFGSLDAQNTLPVRIVSFKADKNAASTLLTWQIAGDKDALKFDVLVSSDNRSYKQLGTINAIDGKLNYGFSDNNPSKGTAYYRLRITTKDGKVVYSKVVVVFQDSDSKMLVTIAPSVTSSFTNVMITAPKAGWTTISLSGMNGQVLRSKALFLREGDNIEKVDLSGVGVGQYIVTITNDKGERHSYRVIRK